MTGARLRNESREVGLWRDGGRQLGHQVVVVGVKELRHVQGLCALGAARQRKVLLVPREMLRQARTQLANMLKQLNTASATP